MVTEPPDEVRKVREAAVAELEGIASILRDADDVEASEIIKAAVKELQATLIARFKGNSPEGRQQPPKGAAASVGASVQSATDSAATAVRTGANRIASEGTPVKASLDKAGSLARSGASGVAAGFTVAHEALTGYAQNLDWSSVVPTEYVSKFVTAGTRGIDRGLEEPVSFGRPFRSSCALWAPRNWPSGSTASTGATSSAQQGWEQ